MTFLNSALLIGLPLIMLPLIIHLLNQRRHRRIDWGAMQFLLTARKTSQGRARLRQILIMAARMLVIAGAILSVSRPLATGWIGGLTGGAPETVIVMVDRSASMQQRQLNTIKTKNRVVLEKIANALEVLGKAKQMVVIDSATLTPRPITEPDQLLRLPQTSVTETSANIPRMLETALNFVVDNQTGRTDIWLCSDSRRNDWDVENSLWESVRSGFGALEGVRFNVINFGQVLDENLSIVAENISRIETDAKNEIVLDIRVRRSANSEPVDQVIPIEVVINGARSIVNARMKNNESLIAGYRIALGPEIKSGWGKVELPADANSSDNTFFFSFADAPPKQTVIVTDNAKAVTALKLVCSLDPQKPDLNEVKVVGPNEVTLLDWTQVALLLWHSQLPQGTLARQVRSYVQSGRSVVFFPPGNQNEFEFEGVRWGDWANVNALVAHRQEADTTEPIPFDSETIGFWRQDADLLRNTRNGDALPLDRLKIYQFCSLTGTDRTLARLSNGQPLLARKSTDSGAIYFCTTLPVSTHSSLAHDGVVLYAMLHRAMQQGFGAVGRAKQLDAGSLLSQMTRDMVPLITNREIIGENRPFCAGVYQKGDQFIALNRPNIEESSVLARLEIETLFAGLDANFVEDSISSGRSLASEVWKLFVVLMGLALLAEAIFSLPEKRTEDRTTTLASIRAAT